MRAELTLVCPAAPRRPISVYAQALEKLQNKMSAEGLEKLLQERRVRVAAPRAQSSRVRECIGRGALR